MEEASKDITGISSSPLNNLNIEQKRMWLMHILANNLPGCDFMLCLFFGALNSNRVDQCIRPFPSLFVRNGSKDFKELKAVCDCVPPLRDILSFGTCSESVMDLLLWLYVGAGLPELIQTNLNELPFIHNLERNAVPNYIFTLQHSKKAVDAWNRRKLGKETFLAFHGSLVHNFYSILKVGLQQHFSSEKMLLYGEGIYLSSEVSVSMNYASFRQTWDHSIFGNKHSIIAVCEVIDDIEKVKCKDMKYRSRSVVSGAFGEVPEKYFVVTDSELVRIKHLLVYKTESGPLWRSYVCNKVTIFLCGYFLVLLLVGLWNSSFWKKFWYKFFSYH